MYHINLKNIFFKLMWTALALTYGLFHVIIICHYYLRVAGAKSVLNCDFCDITGASNLMLGMVIIYKM